MKPVLYYYEHCPYCVRVLAFLQMADIDFEPVVFLNDDEASPIALVGQKMLPILQTEERQYLPESLDIIDYLGKKYGFLLEKDATLMQAVDDFLATNKATIYALSMPRWVEAPLKEFATQSAKDYFIKKKTASIGDFATALANTDALVQEMLAGLSAAEPLFATLMSHRQSEPAIILFSALYGLRYVDGFAWTPALHEFMSAMAKSTRLPLSVC